MSDSSGSSGFPPKIAGADSYPQSMAELKAKIIAIRGEARVQNVREKLEGEVIRNNRDGTTDIKTPRGEITVELPVKDKPPAGTSILLELPKGEPPRHIVIREVRTERPDNVQTQSKESARNQTQEQQPQTRPSSADNVKITPETSLSLSNQTEQTRPAASQAPPVPPLRNGDFVRLTPLPQYETILPLQATVKQAVETIAARADLVAFQITQNLTAQVIAPQSPVTAQPSQPVSATPPIEVLTVSQAPHVSAPAPQTIQILPPQALPQQAASTVSPVVDLIASLSLPPSAAAAPALTAQAVETLQNLPPLTVLQKSIPAIQTMPADTANQQTSSFKAASRTFDVQVNTIFPPPVTISTASTEALAGAAPAMAESKMTASRVQVNVQTMTAMPPIQNIENLLTQTNPVMSKAVVAGQTAQGLPVLSVFMPQQQSWQSFTIPVQPQNLNMGTQMEIMPHIPQQAAAGAMTTSVMPPFIPYEFFSNFSWPAAEEIIQTLNQAAPQAAQILGQATASPAMPTRLPAAALLFVAAVRGGDIAGWLGDKNVDLLKRLGKGDALNRLTRDLGGMQRTASDPASPQDWRGVALPMVSENELSKIMLYYRHDKTDSDEGEKKRGTRFIFDLNLTQMGSVQLDGLHRPISESESRLDLIVRTTKPVSENMRKAMRAVYIEALQQADAIGDISFQNEQEKFVKVDMPKSAVSL